MSKEPAVSNQPSEPATAHRVSSDVPFYAVLSVIGGTYIVLIVAMLVADGTYLFRGTERQQVRLDFSTDDGGRTLAPGDAIASQFDRYGLTVSTREGGRAEVASSVGQPAAERAASVRPMPGNMLVAAGESGALVLSWKDPVQLEALRLAAPADVEGAAVVRAFVEGDPSEEPSYLERSSAEQLAAGRTWEGPWDHVSRVEFELPAGTGVAELQFTWQGRARAAWERDYPWLSRLLYNPVTSALSKPEIRYSIRLSLISCTITAILSLWTAVPIGYLLSRHRFFGRNLIDAILDIPIVLPPLVVGLSLLILFQFAPSFLREAVVYEIPAVILAQYMVACAFAVRTMRATFDQIDVRHEQVALTLGCSRAQAFGMVVLPEARRGMLTAGTLAWARALGEFGPLLIFAGATRQKTEVLSTTVFLELSIGDLGAAVAVSLIMVAAAVIVLIIARLWGTRSLTL